MEIFRLSTRYGGLTAVTCWVTRGTAEISQCPGQLALTEHLHPKAPGRGKAERPCPWDLATLVGLSVSYLLVVDSHISLSGQVPWRSDPYLTYPLLPV